MRALLLTAALGLPAAAAAGEGMWVPDQLPDIAAPLKQAGLALEPSQLADLTGQPMGAVVSLGGCTASFVSPQGLVITNHHCAYGSIQLNSTPQNDLIRDGFNAAALADELPGGPNARVFVTEVIRDVTADVLAGQTPEMDGLARDRAIDAAEKALVAACEREPGRRCSVYSFYGGLTYRLFKQLEIKDVRLVYAPPLGVGNFGGEVDNWMWPRHTGDFSFLRAYVGKDGRPAPYAKDNVPYRPIQVLKLGGGVAESDFVMVAGYPGSTFRHALAVEFDDTTRWTYPTRIRSYRDEIGIVEAAGAKDKDLAIKYANFVKSRYNYLKNMQGQLDGFASSGAAARKRRAEQELLAWLRTRGDAGRPALDAYARLVEADAAKRATRERDTVVAAIGNTGLLSAAAQLYRLSIERGKPDAQREAGFQLRDEPTLQGNLQQMERRYDPRVDRQLLAYWLGRYRKLPNEQRVAEIDAWLGGNAAAVTKAIDGLYAGTALGTLAARERWFAADRAAIQASDDSALKAAITLMPLLLRNEEAAKRRAGDDARDRPRLLQAVIDYSREQGRAVYPDANGSLRITFGKVQGYSPKPGVVQTPFTRLQEIAGKATATPPFDAPRAELDAIRDQRYGARAAPFLGTVPVNFLASLDITGGNSGSPALDAEGRLVGLVFDMNWESVASNWLFDPAVTRAIQVDIRYVLWFMEQVERAPRLLQEMGAAEPMDVAAPR